MPRYLKTLILILAIFAIWQFIAILKIWPDYLLPTPSGVGEALLRGWQNGSLFTGITVSMVRIVLGFLVSVFLGALIGIPLGMNQSIDEWLGGLVVGLQSLPSICWLPLAILWFGLNEQAILFVVVMGSTLAIAISMRDGIKNMPPVFVKAAHTMGAKGLTVYSKVIMPALLPSLITGMKLGWAFAWRSLMAAELIFVSGGLGFLLETGRELNDMSQVMAVIIIIIALGLLIDQIVFKPLWNNIAVKWGMEKA